MPSHQSRASGNIFVIAPPAEQATTPTVKPQGDEPNLTPSEKLVVETQAFIMDKLKESQLQPHEVAYIRRTFHEQQKKKRLNGAACLIALGSSYPVAWLISLVTNFLSQLVAPGIQFTLDVKVCIVPAAFLTTYLAQACRKR
jgi:hypothetical protein